MSAAAFRTGSRPALLWGALIVLVWAALTSLLGSSAAHADDDAERPLDSVTSFLGGTLSKVSDTVTGTVAPVTDVVVDKVVKPVVAPVQKAAEVVAPVVKTTEKVPVVGDVVAPVVKQTASQVTHVSQKVTETLKSSPVAAVVAPITDTVASVPVVGKVVTDLGVLDVADDVVDVVDGTLGATADVVDTTVPPIVDAVTPGPSVNPGPVVTPPWPLEPISPDTEADSVTAPSSAADEGMQEQALTAPSEAIASRLAHPSWSSNVVAVRASASPADATDAAPAASDEGQSTPPATPSPSSATSTGAFAQGARTGHDAAMIDAHRLSRDGGVRTSFANDDFPPPAPVADTDSSPD